MVNNIRVALTGFMGVGKSSVARHLSFLLQCDRIDLDHVIEGNERRSIIDIIDNEGEAAYRSIETRCLEHVLAETDAAIVSLGGGAWIQAENRRLIRSHGVTSIWLESSFDHCWHNIRASKKERPLARDRNAAKRLFIDRQKLYCLADWHFIIKPEFTSYQVARQIAEEVFSVESKK